jgi:hypothetical protein
VWSRVRTVCRVTGVLLQGRDARLLNVARLEGLGKVEWKLIDY